MEKHNVDQSGNHTKGIAGFQRYSFQYSEEKMIQRLKRKGFCCPQCFHCPVTADHDRTRRIQGLPYGNTALYFEEKLLRTYCPRWHALSLTRHWSERSSNFVRKWPFTRSERISILTDASSKPAKTVIRNASSDGSSSNMSKFIGIDEIAIGHTETGKNGIRDDRSGACFRSRPSCGSRQGWQCPQRFSTRYEKIWVQNQAHPRKRPKQTFQELADAHMKKKLCEVLTLSLKTFLGQNTHCFDG